MHTTKVYLTVTNVVHVQNVKAMSLTRLLVSANANVADFSNSRNGLKWKFQPGQKAKLKFYIEIK